MPLDKEQFEHIFVKTKERYDELQDVEINLRFHNECFFSMRASIYLSSFFKKKRRYFINVNLKRSNIFLKLSEDDLMGWFGHELAHIVDYETMNNFKLLLFTFKYIFDLKFRFFVEKRINVLTSNNGLAKELFYVWKKFVSMDQVSDKYKRYIIKNYRPEWEDIKEMAQVQGVTKEVYESLK